DLRIGSVYAGEFVVQVAAAFGNDDIGYEFRVRDVVGRGNGDGQFLDVRAIVSFTRWTTGVIVSAADGLPFEQPAIGRNAILHAVVGGRRCRRIEIIPIINVGDAGARARAIEQLSFSA